MKTVFRTTAAFANGARQDLGRRHPFAHERVAWVTVKAALGADHLVLVAEDYLPVNDADYVRDPRVGAMMGQEAIRKALEVALLRQVGIFHIHMHDHFGLPEFSVVDLTEQRKFVPDFFKIRPELPHGALVMSRNRMAGRVWLGPQQIADIDEFNVVGPRFFLDLPFAGRGRGIVA